MLLNIILGLRLQVVELLLKRIMDVLVLLDTRFVPIVVFCKHITLSDRIAMIADACNKVVVLLADCLLVGLRCFCLLNP